MLNTCSSHSGTTPKASLLPQLKYTTLCKYYARGYCKNSQCPFAHGRQRLRPPPDLYRTRMCKNGSDCCSDGCPYAHSRDQIRQTGWIKNGRGQHLPPTAAAKRTVIADTDAEPYRIQDAGGQHSPPTATATCRVTTEADAEQLYYVKVQNTFLNTAEPQGSAWRRCHSA